MDSEGEAFVLAGGGVVSKEDFCGGEEFAEEGLYGGELTVHTEGEGLYDEEVFVLVYDEAGEVIGFAPDEAADGFCGVAVVDGGGEGAAEVGGIEGFVVQGVTAPADFGLAVVEAAAEEAAFGVAEGDAGAVLLCGEGGLDFVCVGPGVAFEGARAVCGEL